MAYTKKKIISLSINIILVLFIAALLFVPGFKAKMMSGLMSLGLFKPSIEKVNSTTKTASTANVNFTKTDGTQVSYESLKGRVVFINFWATWCQPCLAEMPSINSLYNQFKENDNIVFLMVDADNDLQKSEAFLKEKKFDFPVYGTNDAIPAEWFTQTLPTTVVLDKSGKIVFHHEGIANYGTEEFQNFVKDLIAK